MGLISLSIFIAITFWFYAKTGGYHNFLLAKEETQKQIDKEESEILNSLPPDFLDKYEEAVSEDVSFDKEYKEK